MRKSKRGNQEKDCKSLLLELNQALNECTNLWKKKFVVFSLDEFVPAKQLNIFDQRLKPRAQIVDEGGSVNGSPISKSIFLKRERLGLNCIAKDY